MSLQKKEQKGAVDMVADDEVESFGVCSKNNSFNNEQRKFILHLRVHTNNKTHSQPTTPEHSSHDPFLPDTETYNDLMRYKPELSDVPVAYEQKSTDSCPFMLVKPQTGEKNTTKDYSTKMAPMSLNNCCISSSGVTALQECDCTGDNTMHTDDVEFSAGMDNQKHCWWCTHSFKHEPFSMPIRLSTNNQYDTVGCFCSPECTASYIFNNKSGVCDPWKQYEMLHRMVNKQHNGVEMRIKLAPPRETLQRYGGPYDIATYRNILQDYRKHIHVSMPPINPIQKMIEEVAVDYTKKRHKFLPIDSTRVKKAENELCLKRKKKQSSENTLEAFMRLRMGKTN